MINLTIKFVKTERYFNSFLTKSTDGSRVSSFGNFVAGWSAKPTFKPIRIKIGNISYGKNSAL